MNKLQFKNEWRIARSNCESLSFINKMLMIRDTHNSISNPLYIELVKNPTLKKSIEIDRLTRLAIIHDRSTRVFSFRNCAKINGREV